MSDQDIIQRLDRLIAIQQLVHKDTLVSARAAIREDSVSAEILDATSDWVPAGKLKESVMQRAKQSEPTVKRRIAALIDVGALDKRGSGSTVSYRANGLI